MSNREEALRKIFEATGVSGRLTDDQKRELLTHLEDAVAAKTAAGTAEVDAIGQAFAELGPLPRIADQLSLQARLLAAWSRGAALKGLALLGLLAFFQAFLTPRFAHFFQETGAAAPGLLMMFVSAGESELLPLAAVVLTALGALQIVARRKNWTERTRSRLRMSALALYGVAAVFSAAMAAGCLLGMSALFGTLLP